MQYSDIFTKPITECTDEEIIARAIELREKNSIPRVVKAAKAEREPKEPKAPKLSKAEQAMQQALELAKRRQLELAQGTTQPQA